MSFPITAAGRQKSGDLSRSIAERYSGKDPYMIKFTKTLAN